MSPRKITRLALAVAGMSIIGLLVVVFTRPDWGLWNWWPAMGLGLAVLLLITSYLRGAYLAAQRRAAMVDLLNDCYTGVRPEQEEVIIQ
jgi:hypothetical protein